MVSTLVRAQEKLNELGILYKAPSGYVMQSPLLSVVNQCVETITKLSREFGLTPASRSRLLISDKDGVLISGTHTLTIETAGTADPASRGSWIWVDAFDIKP